MFYSKASPNPNILIERTYSMRTNVDKLVKISVMDEISSPSIKSWTMKPQTHSNKTYEPKASTTNSCPPTIIVATKPNEPFEPSKIIS